MIKVSDLNKTYLNIISLYETWIIITLTIGKPSALYGRHTPEIVKEISKALLSASQLPCWEQVWDIVDCQIKCTLLSCYHVLFTPMGKYETLTQDRL